MIEMLQQSMNSFLLPAYSLIRGLASQFRKIIREILKFTQMHQMIAN